MERSQHLRPCTCINAALPCPGRDPEKPCAPPPASCTFQALLCGRDLCQLPLQCSHTCIEARSSQARHLRLSG